MAKAETQLITSRRSFLATAAVAGVIAPHCVAVAANAPIDPVTLLSNEFEAALATMDEFFRNEPPGATDDDYKRVFAPVSATAKRVADMKATSLAGLKVKARVLQWCNREFDFMSGNSMDERLAYGLVQDLLSLPST